MAQALLQTKLFPPRLRQDLVERPELRQKLDGLLQVPLTLIAAPAGFGKTTLITDWLASVKNQKLQVAWLSLEPDDNDVERFYRYLFASIDRVQPGALKQSARLSEAEWPDRETLSIALINDLAQLEGDLVIVLDDFHAIEAPELLETFGMFTERMAPNTHIVLTSRSEPDLSLHRLRARGQLLEIGPAELRFNQQEATDLLNGPGGPQLDHSTTELLHNRTEGWAAGLQLAAISLQSGRAVDDFLAQFTGENRFLFSYFAEEVLRSLPEESRQFLLETSILERMTGNLCDALTGNSNGASMLADLANRNMFTLRLDDQGRWFRYHHLFRQFLRTQAASDNAVDEPALHAAASRWFESNRSVEEAVTHAIASGDFDRARGLIEPVVSQMAADGQMARIESWADRLPTTLVESSPDLMINRTWISMFRFDPAATDEAVEVTENLLRGLSSRTPPEGLGEHLTELWLACQGIRGYNAVARGDAVTGLRQLLEVRQSMSNSTSFAAQLLEVGIGFGQFLAQDIASGRDTLRKAASSTISPFIRAMATSFVGQSYIFDARLEEAREMAERAIEYAEQNGSGSMPVLAFPKNALAAIAWEQHELDEAEQYLDAAMRASAGMHSEVDKSASLATSMGIASARGDYSSALKSVDELIERATAARDDDAIEYAWSFRIKVLVMAGRIEDALSDANEHLRPIDLPSDELAPPVHLATEWLKAWVRVFLAIDNGQEALRLADILAESATRNAVVAEELDALVLKSLGLHSVGKTDDAMELLGRALVIGEPSWYVRAFADEGQLMGNLLAEFKRRKLVGVDGGPSGAYVSRLIAVISGADRGAKATSTAPGTSLEKSGEPISLPESITPREIEILRMIAFGDSNAQIAERLFVTSATVKTHINNLYRKMEVKSRTQAVARGRGLGVLVD